MKNILACFIAIVVLGIFGYGIYMSKNQQHSDTAKYHLLPRNGELSFLPEWKKIINDEKYYASKLISDPSDKRAYLGLAAIYLQEARVTGNLNYYHGAAMQSLEAVLKLDPENFEALAYKAMILMSEHRFKEGLVLAEKLKKQNPYNAFIYGLLVDANLELGNMDAAIANADKMVSIRPDLRSYSRVSYIRENLKDLPGAIDAMEMAVDAGMPGDESTEWSRVHLGKLYEKNNDFRNAEIEYALALENRPQYPYAIAGMARVAFASNDYQGAIEKYEKAMSIIGDHEFRDGLQKVKNKIAATH